MFSINANASVGASQNVYGGGFELDLSRDGLNTNILRLSYNYIDGKDGIQDDQRVELSWTYGFGSGPTQVASAETHDVSTIRPAADVAMVLPANNLLNDVTKRPAYLPQTVIARARAADAPVVPSCSSLDIEAFYGKFLYIVYGSTPYVDMVLDSPEYDLSTATVTLGTTELTYIPGATPPGYRFAKEAETVYTDGETQTLTVEVDGKTCTDTVTADVVNL